MTLSPRQLVLDLPHRPARGVEDFLVSPSNAAAVAFIDRWPDWPLPSVLVVGARQSGKTHLAHVWRLRTGAEAIDATRLDEAAISRLATCKALVIEDLDRGIADERILFHLLNSAREIGGSLLLTSECTAGELEPALPDLRSRLRALPMVRIAQPDEYLIGAVLVKLFGDRQLTVEPHVIGHVARHLDRSMAAIVGFVDAVDRAALAAKRKVTRTLVNDVLKEVGRDVNEEEEQPN